MCAQPDFPGLLEKFSGRGSSLAKLLNKSSNPACTCSGPTSSPNSILAVSAPDYSMRELVLHTACRDFCVSIMWMYYIGRPQLLSMDSVRYRNGEIGFVFSMSQTDNLGYPFPTFEWFQDNNGPLANDSRRTFGYPELTITRVQVSDSGTYSLVAMHQPIWEVPTRVN